MSHYGEVNTIMGAVAGEAGLQGVGGGKTYPGAVVPFGMVQLSPDTVTGGDNGAGYSYGHKTIEGFSWVHMSGIGWYGEFGNLQTMPMSGKRRYFSGTNCHNTKRIGEEGWQSRYDHAHEITRAGYYAVELTDYDIYAEAAAARHSGALRFTFRRGGESHIVIDLHRRIGGHSDAQYVKVVDERRLEGKILCTPAGGGWGHGAGKVRYELHFVMCLSKSMKTWAMWDEGEIFENKREMYGRSLGFIGDFDLERGEQVEVHAAISFVDMNGARNNFSLENKSFEEIKNDAECEWTKALSLIDIEGGTAEEREIFYTSLYHTMLDPRDFSDCDGRYRADMCLPERTEGFTFRTIFSGWDVFRSAFPLFTLLRPDVVRDEINSLMKISEMNNGAMFPRWEIMGIESGCMVGDPGTNVLCDAYMKGIGGYDAERAYRICRRWWLGDRKAEGELKDFNRLRYFPADISKTMEYSFTAWCLHQMAEKLGHAEDAQKFFGISKNWKKLYNPENGWLNRRDENGAFLSFDGKYDERGCAESNVYQQIWFVPHDIKGLQKLMGEARFVQELEELFEKADLSAFWNDNYNHSNEPVHTVPHIFNQIGLPHRTQYWVRRIQKEAYRTGAYGYCGNEDVGQMSAWFVLTAMGIHQSVVSSNIFELNTPLFPKTKISLDSEYHSCSVSDVLEIVTDFEPHTHPYIEGVELNGKKIERTYLTWEEISGGGVVRFLLSKTPTRFGGKEKF